MRLRVAITDEYMVSWRFQSSFLSSYKLRYIKVQNFCKPLYRQLTIYCVRHWAYSISSSYAICRNAKFLFSGLDFFIECQSGTGWQALTANLGQCLACGVCGMCLAAKGRKVLAQYMFLFYQL